ncbi:MAG: hypothetical protein ACREOM_09475 [Candidatus Dormibacteraceae bacterium]
MGILALRQSNVVDEMIDPTSWNRPVWIHEGIIGYSTSGNIAKTTASSPDDPEIVKKVNQFKALAASARGWAEFNGRPRQARHLERSL